MNTEAIDRAAARKFMEAKTTSDLEGVITFAADRYLPISGATRRSIDAAADMAREILASRSIA